jgi:hypothetical protein
LEVVEVGLERVEGGDGVVDRTKLIYIIGELMSMNAVNVNDVIIFFSLVK